MSQYRRLARMGIEGVAGKDEHMPEKLRERILETCGGLTPEQQQLMIEFIWLRAHCPRELGERTQKRLIQVLDSADIEASRITDALKEAVAALHHAISAVGGTTTPGRCR